MSKPLEKVVRLSTDTIYSMIQTFLDDKGSNSPHTRRAYEDDIAQFFQYMKNKRVEELSREDLDVTYNEVLQYKHELLGQYHGNSVKRKLSSLRELYRHLKKTFKDLDADVFDDVCKKIKAATHSYGILSYEEAMALAEAVKKQRLGQVKSALIHTAIRTSFRLNALLQLTWDDIMYMNDKWVISALEKGEVIDKKPIPDFLYEQLLAIKEDDNRVFHLSENTIYLMMKNACEELGIDPRRNITFHSLRKVAINWALDFQHDIKLAQRQGNHKSVTTTLQHYAATKDDFSNMPGMLMGQKPDMTVLADLSREQLLSLISDAGYDVQMTLVSLQKKKDSH